MLLLAKFSVVGAGSIPTVNCEIVLPEPEPEPGEVVLGLEVAHAASAKLPSSKAPNAEESFLELGRMARPSRHQQIRLVATEAGPRPACIPAGVPLRRKRAERRPTVWQNVICRYLRPLILLWRLGLSRCGWRSGRAAPWRLP